MLRTFLVLVVLSGCATPLRYRALTAGPTELSADGRVMRVQDPTTLAPIAGAEVHLGNERFVSDVNGLVRLPSRAEDPVVQLFPPAGVEKYEIVPLCAIAPAAADALFACQLSCDQFVLGATCGETVAASVTFGMPGMNARALKDLLLKDFVDSFQRAYATPLWHRAQSVMLASQARPASVLAANSEDMVVPRINLRGWIVAIEDARKPRVVMCTDTGTADECPRVLESLFHRTEGAPKQ